MKEEKEEKEDNVEMGLGLIQGVIGLGFINLCGVCIINNVKQHRYD